MKAWNLLSVLAACLASLPAYASDTLSVYGINFGHSEQAYIAPGGHNGHEYYLNSDYGSLDVGGKDYSLSQMYSADLKDPLGLLPSSYQVNVVPVKDEEAWLIKNIGDKPNLSAAQDAGLQLAIWAVENPGTMEMKPNDPMALKYMGFDLAMAHGQTAQGYLLEYQSGGSGHMETFVVAQAVPEPAPFIGLGLGLVGLGAFRSRRRRDRS
jgi:hypothetical protein